MADKVERRSERSEQSEVELLDTPQHSPFATPQGEQTHEAPENTEQMEDIQIEMAQSILAASMTPKEDQEPPSPRSRPNELSPSSSKTATRDLENGEITGSGLFSPDYIFVLVLENEALWEPGILYSADELAQRKKDAKAYRLKVVESLKRAGFLLKKHMSRDNDEFFIKISAPQAMLEDTAESLDNFKVKIKRERLDAVVNAELSAQERLQLEGGYARFEVDKAREGYYEGKHTPDGRFVFRSKNAMLLAATKMQTPVDLGGAGLDLKQDCRAGRALMFFPIHQKDGLDELTEEWANFKLICSRSILDQPLDKVCDYFGCEVAMYFAYLGLYTRWLVLPSVAGMVCFLVQIFEGSYDTKGAIVAYALFTCFWSTLFLEAWKREQITLAHRWGTMGIEDVETVRPEFIEVAEAKKNPYTAEPEWFYPTEKRRVKYLITYGIPVLMMLMVCGVVLVVFYMRYWLESHGHPGAIAGVANGIVIAIFNAINRVVGVRLTDLEHHRTDTEYSDSLIAKSFIFQFVNNYAPLYLVAFIKANSESFGLIDYLGECKCRDFQGLNGKDSSTCVQGDLYGTDASCVCQVPSCIDELAVLLLTIFGVQLTIGNLVEFFLPWFLAKFRLQAEEAGMDNLKEMTEAEYESKLEEYDALEGFDDYNEMVIQFGFISLFAPSFPLVALMGLVNNAVELRSDSNKLVQVFQRPMARLVEDIGTWETILDLMTYISVATNVGLVWFTSEFGVQYSAVSRVWGFLITEHVLMVIKCAVAFAIPDVPEDVKVRISAQDFLTEKALGKKLEDQYSTENDPWFRPHLTDNDQYASGDEADPELSGVVPHDHVQDDQFLSLSTERDMSTPRMEVLDSEVGVAPQTNTAQL